MWILMFIGEWKVQKCQEKARTRWTPCVITVIGSAYMFSLCVSMEICSACPQHFFFPAEATGLLSPPTATAAQIQIAGCGSGIKKCQQIWLNCGFFVTNQGTRQTKICPEEYSSSPHSLPSLPQRNRSPPSRLDWSVLSWDPFWFRLSWWGLYVHQRERTAAGPSGTCLRPTRAALAWSLSSRRQTALLSQTCPSACEHCVKTGGKQAWLPLFACVPKLQWPWCTEPGLRPSYISTYLCKSSLLSLPPSSPCSLAGK